MGVQTVAPSSISAWFQSPGRLPCTLSAAQRHTHFLDSPRMTAVLGRSDFRFADLKTGTATVFLVLPPDRLATYSRWLRLLVAQSLQDIGVDDMHLLTSGSGKVAAVAGFGLNIVDRMPIG